MSDNLKAANTQEPSILHVNVGENVKASESTGPSPFQNPAHDPRVAGLAMAVTIEDVIKLAPLAVQLSRDTGKPAIITVMGFVKVAGK